MVYRCFTEKKTGFDLEAAALLKELTEVFGIDGAKRVRIINRYDVEGISKEVFEAARSVVFSEPQTDICFDETPAVPQGGILIAVGALPGQFDQRADSCAQCIQMLAGGERPHVATAKLYLITGELRAGDAEIIKTRLINPVESREASLEPPETLALPYPAPESVGEIEGFCGAGDGRLSEILSEYGLAMDLSDLRFMRDFFRGDMGRDPTVTELKVADTYWSDHCRHSTFNTRLEDVRIADEAVNAAYSAYLEARREVYGKAEAERPVTLMDLATIASKLLKKRGELKNLDESEEINACSVRVEAKIDGRPEDWLLMFKNETHNHPTEIEPFGGAATCIGGAIRDPLSGRAYVYQAMRVTGSGDPRTPVAETLCGKLPQRLITTMAARGYSSYGNQIGLATGLVDEIYHPGYVAKRMEIGAVIGAAPAANVVRERPAPGDVVILTGGRTGRDGIGGATGSSKTHNAASLATMSSEVQKGNAPEQRKLQRLFRSPEAARLIKRCNDFGAGGVAVAIGELADGLDIDLGLIRKKYEGLNATELAISESQERMAVVTAPENAEAFIRAAEAENLEAYAVARVTDAGRVTMTFNGQTVCGLPREFLASGGAGRSARVSVPRLGGYEGVKTKGSPVSRILALASDIRFCSRRGLSERFDSSIGASSVIAPYGGKNQLTPAQVMVSLLPSENGDCSTCSVMSYGFDPYHSELNPFTGARDAVVVSVAKLVAAGCPHRSVYLSFQEYFGRLRDEPERWGAPFAALLGAFTAQMGLKTAAIGGKDSMSGSFLDMDVPPTLVSFAVSTCEASEIISPEFKEAGHRVYLLNAGTRYNDMLKAWSAFGGLAATGAVKAAWAVAEGFAAEGIFKMALGNSVGFTANPELNAELLFENLPGSILFECDRPVDFAVLLGMTADAPEISVGGEKVTLDALREVWEAPLEGVFPTAAAAEGSAEWRLDARKDPREIMARAPGVVGKRPLALIPVFPGTNCEYDTARAVRLAGGEAEVFVMLNLTPGLLEQSARELEKAIGRAQMLILPGGFSGGDEPDGSGKFIAAFFRNPGITDAVYGLLHRRDGLMLGICNGFQALVKLGLVPYGEIRPMDERCPTLTHNLIGRHQSRYVTTRIMDCRSPWLSLCSPGQRHVIPVSHGEGRFIAPPEVLDTLVKNRQIATVYVDGAGAPSMDISANPNGSYMAIEGIVSPDGRVFGKMGHSERRGEHVAINIPGDKHQPIFEAGVRYFLL